MTATSPVASLAQATMARPTTDPVPDPRPRGRVAGWEYAALAVLLVGTAFAYLWDLGASGWANSFYAAAAQAGSASWKAFFFGSSDAANSITVDKPPASLWLMSLSIRAFGLSSWSMLVPQALLGVASVGLLWAIVRRSSGPAAGLLAGLVLACTPVAALMFRFNNPDALLVFLMIAAVGALLRAVETGRTRWLVATGVLVGFGFLTKQLQVMLVVPPLALGYLVAGPPKLGKRVLQLLAAGVSMLVAAGWWVAAVELWPASSRPWIGGSQHNSILELTFGYNGLGRLSGNEMGSVGPGGPGGMGDIRERLAEAGIQLPPGFEGGPGGPGGPGGMWGGTGITRMFEPAQGGQITWLIPAALLLLALGLVLRGRAPRTDVQRAALLVWGGWLLVTGLTFSFMAGIFHQYYTVALAPAIAALIGIGTVLAWRSRERWWVRVAFAAIIAMTGWMAWVLLSRTPDFQPWLRWVVVVAAVLGAGAVLVRTLLTERFGALTALVVAVAALGGPVAYAADTVATPHNGPIVTAGPNTGFGFGPGGMGGRRGEGRTGGMGGFPMPPGGQPGALPIPGGMPGGMPGQTPGGQPGALPVPGGMPGGMPGQTPGGQPGTAASAQMFEAGGPGGFMEGRAPTAAIVEKLTQDADGYTWAAATVGANNASGYQLSTQLPVMPIGGFNGTDPSPTLSQFQEYVAQHKIHWFIASGGMFGGRGGTGPSAQIIQWVEQNFTATQIDGVTMYDLAT